MGTPNLWEDIGTACDEPGAAARRHFAEEAIHNPENRPAPLVGFDSTRVTFAPK